MPHRHPRRSRRLADQADAAVHSRTRGVGIVEQVGAAVTEHAVGDRLAIPWLGYACGACDYCVSGRETLCEAQ
ncbi:MAG TPA: alcohol dehydrogenase catalytic domain-containing protein [Nonomuraea sp.]|nr:alcohol dehydrogenase catalytic domain-containing protein [Nonomuraea sp.]